jgi:hypothetical protein
VSNLEYEILHKNVYYFPGVIKEIDSVMKTLDEVNSLSVTPWEVWYANNDSKEHPYGDLKTLNKSLLEEETDPAVKEKSLYVLDSILGAMSETCKEFLKQHGADQQELYHVENEILNGTHTYGIRRYDENLGMGPHQDMVIDSRDTITVAVYLDDQYEGGELGIVHEGLDISIKNKAGSIVVFPSGYFHESKNLISGRKTIITHVHMPINKLIDMSV